MGYDPHHKFEEYLGDGVYASFDGYHIWLKTQTGDAIALEPSVLQSLMYYQARLMNHFTEIGDDSSD